MSKLQWSVTGCALFVSAFLAVGCSQSSSRPSPAASSSANDHAEREHATVGPHGGNLIELGDEEFHAELVHDEGSGAVTVYMLGSDAKTSKAVEASELTINLTHDGQAEQFKLAASPDTSDPQGNSSRFVSNDAELGEDLEHEGTNPQLVGTIGGKQYRGTIVHGDHGHEAGHKH